ncbi:nucleotide disphospho-sugar-binding domain-containing protein [Streptomyces sp. R11]|uniref:Nucleotide disphospho-sugar-binding domain-containing protein n=1 Tax=Streptomyces sp. R11 TaxID=3238625 RepID=A0AB39N7Q2_9ACTN
MDDIRKMVTRVLGEPSFQRASEALRQDILASPSPAEVVPVLERLVAEYRATI